MMMDFTWMPLCANILGQRFYVNVDKYLPILVLLLSDEYRIILSSALLQRKDKFGKDLKLIYCTFPHYVSLIPPPSTRFQSSPSDN
jgi:hypothetical protein